ncbi:hypothetical protein FZF11_04095 [Vibrio parahaemolyticus]|jgi:hypothetical protein|nr:hypothetical protein [Vibrio parahaemolyticus]MQZ00051.1 hypothetical protein [Vibrio parahaemolyticus]MQZ09077.1 hypothetical protein [Vibrio parahaemolyticus]MRE08655.1 hypothetical protein [Vibrio parahaemolyticus]NKJ89015.1 hypothetical protein [Vibrio parahaemolyticus]
MFSINLNATFAHCNNIFSVPFFAISNNAQALSNKGKRLFGLTAKHTVKKR